MNIAVAEVESEIEASELFTTILEVACVVSVIGVDFTDIKMLLSTSRSKLFFQRVEESNSDQCGLETRSACPVLFERAGKSGTVTGLLTTVTISQNVSLLSVDHIYTVICEIIEYYTDTDNIDIVLGAPYDPSSWENRISVSLVAIVPVL